MGLLSVVYRKRHWARDQRVVLPFNTCVALGKPLDLSSLCLIIHQLGKCSLRVTPRHEQVSSAVGEISKD